MKRSKLIKAVANITRVARRKEDNLQDELESEVLDTLFQLVGLDSPSPTEVDQCFN